MYLFYVLYNLRVILVHIANKQLIVTKENSRLSATVVCGETFVHRSDDIVSFLYDRGPELWLWNVSSTTRTCTLPAL